MTGTATTVTALEKRVTQWKAEVKSREGKGEPLDASSSSPSTDASLISLAEDIVATLKAGKASTAEQKASLYAMLAVVPTDQSWSADAVTSALAYVGKETQESCVRALMSALSKHLSFCLQRKEGEALATAAAKVLGKELNNAKIPIRKAICVGVGEVIWSQAQASSSATIFVEGILAGLEANLKNASVKPLTSPSGPLEGYVAVAALLGRAGLWDSVKITAFIQKNETIKSLSSTSPKPPFLLNDKVIRKAATADEEIWLLRAIDGLLTQNASAVLREPGALDAVSLAIRHIAFSSRTAKARNESAIVLHSIAKREPACATAILSHGLTTWFMGLEVKQMDESNEENESQDSEKEKEFGRAIKKLMASIFSALAKDSDSVKFDALTSVFVLAHHPELGLGRRQVFRQLCQMAKVELQLFVDVRITQLLDHARQLLNMPQLRQAALDSLSTLVLFSPDEAASLLMTDIRTGLGLESANSFTPQDLGIWKTSSDDLYVDVLSQEKDAMASRKGGKESAMEKWDAELRDSIAKKKANASKTLTKEQQKAVDQQREVEKEVRARVQGTRARMGTALAMIISLIEARTHATDTFMSELVSMVTALLECKPARALVVDDALKALDSLSTCCAERVGEYSTVIRMALLRTIEDELVSEEYRKESMKEMMLGILYRLRFLCEQSPLDLASVSFIEPIISKTIKRNGLGVDADDTDGTLEQVQLALDFITFHGEACRDVRFPRFAFIDDLTHIVAHNTQLAKDAVSALRTLGDAIKGNASAVEIDCLLNHSLADEVYVRTGALQALQPLDLTDIDFCAPLWLTCHDEDEENARLANKAWEENGLDIPEQYSEVLLPMLEHSHAFVRVAAGRSIATACEVYSETTSSITKALMVQYRARNAVLETEYDQFGMPIEATVNREDPWRARSAIASTFYHMSLSFVKEDLVPFFTFLIDEEALGDRNEQVRRAMLDAATAIIDAHGALRLSELIEKFESYLQSSSSKTSNDDITEAVIILFGRLAKHLERNDPRVSKVVDRLVEALKTPSELVQVAVAECLVPLARFIEKDVPALIERLFHSLLHSPKYGERRGAAYGLAGLVKGRGITSIAEFRIMQRLEEAMEDKKDANARQGAVMAYETMIQLLQRLFEPYVPQVLPQLLSGFGDGTPDVRDATQETARVMMQNISGFGVRLIFPSLLSGLDDKQWRIKRGAIELLGAMAYCAPRQLSQFLPTVIPNLNEPIKDSHKQVRQAAEAALKGFGDVISNPEVKKLVPVIMKALVDPTRTPIAQRAILNQKWIHVLDGPSLALLIPVIDRGLRERGAQVQKDAARIVGNLASLTDSKDFVPYLQTLVPLVRTVLVSPVPDARATAAKSLGTLVERLGEVHFVDLVPSLLQVLKSDLSSVDRQGSAQGLAEVLAGLGVERMEALLPDVIHNAQSSSRASVRESHILLLIFLPATFGLRFAPYLGRIIPPILGGIADESDSVREASMRAGRMIIANYSARAVDLLLPELEAGLFDESWRIRLSSVQLISDLLFRLAGITGTNEVEDEDGDDGDGERGAEQNMVASHSIQKSLAESLGLERRDQLLAKMYVLRQDVVVNVRQAAIQLWKVIVNNTPKVAREILSLLVDLLVDLLPRGDESQEMAGRALGELVSKLGERILAETIPMLRRKGVCDDAQLRTGVCLAVIEVMNNGSDEQLEDHQDSLIAIVRNGLMDPSRSVRQAAAEAFEALHERLGSYAIEEIVPGLLESLVNDEDDEDDEEEAKDVGKDEEDQGKEDGDERNEEEDEEEDENEAEDEDEEEEDDDDDESEQGRALSALKEIMRSSAYSVFPVVVPTLIEQPMSAFNAAALAMLAARAGGALNKSLESVLEAMVEAVEAGEQDEDIQSSLSESLSSLLSCIYDSDGVYALMDILLEWSKNDDDSVQRLRGCRYFALFCHVKDEDADMGTYGLDWVQRLVSLFNDAQGEVVDAAVRALEALIKIVPKEDLESIAVPLRETLQVTGRTGKLLPGFMRPKGAAPLGAVFLAGLMNGTADQRENGAYGLADIVERSSAESIKPLIVSMIGPLIRSCGDRHTWAVKRAILFALTAMLRFPQHCKPFFPQLQRSFQKSIADATHDDVHEQAEEGLQKLMECQARGFKPLEEVQ